MKKKQEGSGLSLKPQHVSPTTWYYEVQTGIEVIHEIRDAEGDYVRTDHIKIGWAKLRASLNRYERKAAKKRRKK